MDASNKNPDSLALWLSAAIMLWLGPGYFLFAVLSEADWAVIAMAALAAASSGLIVELGTRGGETRVRVGLVHPVLFGCAITLGPYGSMLCSATAGLFGVVSQRRSHVPLYRLLHCLLGPVTATAAASAAFVWCGGSTSWPHGANSLWAVACAAAVYSFVSALTYGAARAAESRFAAENPQGSEAPVSATAVAAGWSASLAGGYALAIIYSAAPAYAVCVVGVVTVGAALALGASRREQAAASGSGQFKPHEQSRETAYYVDPATGLANRRYLELYLDREMVRSQRLNKPLSVAVFNVDGFTGLDEEAGERAMTALGRRLAREIREYDIAARHSDARVVVLLPETSTETALEVVERLRTAASAGLQDEAVTLSVGLASFPEHAVNARDLINAAHYALNRGRGESSDRVHIPENLKKAS